MSQTNSKEGEIANIDLCKNMSDRMSQLCMSHNYSDVVFIVEGEKLSAHKCILAAGNKYFESLLYGDLLESNKEEIELKVPLEAFKVLLRFIYSGRICLKNMEEETVLDTLVLANTYDFMDLEVAIVRYLKDVVTLENVWDIFRIAWHCELIDLKEVCYNLLDMNASKLLAQKSFNGMPEKLLQDMLRRDSFLAPEFEIFTAVRDWCKHNPDGSVDSILTQVRFPLMSDNELTKVRESGIVNVEKLMDAVEVRGKSEILPYRVWPGENMNTFKFGSLMARINAFPYKFQVELGTTCIINHIEFEFKKSYTFSYFIEVCTEQSEWEKLIDHSHCSCEDLQSLFFPPKYMKYIRFVETSDTGLEGITLKAMYTIHTH